MEGRKEMAKMEPIVISVAAIAGNQIDMLRSYAIEGFNKPSNGAAYSTGLLDRARPAL